MIRSLLYVMIKRYKGLFISMVIICMLAVSMLTGLTASISDTYQSYLKFCADYEVANFSIATQQLAKSDELIAACNVDGVQKTEAIIETPAYITSPNDSFSTAMLSVSLNTNNKEKYSVQQTEKSDDKINVSVENRYATNNSIHAGDCIDINYFGINSKAFVSNIVYTPETIYVKSNYYTLTDNNNFGYIFLDNSEYVKLVNNVIDSTKNHIDSLKLSSIVNNGKIQYCNLLKVNCKDGSDHEYVMQEVQKSIDKITEINAATLKEDTSSAKYMQKFNASFGKLSLLFPCVFYLIMLFVVVLFLNQIALYLKKDIGILVAQGASKKNIISFFGLFAASMSTIGFMCGTLLGLFLRKIASSFFSEIYQIPIYYQSNNWYIFIISYLAALLVSVLAVIISSRQILKVTPKEILNNDAIARTQINQRLEEKLNKLGGTFKLIVCLTIQNNRRFITSVFSIMAATAIIVLATQFFISNKATLPQLFDERCYFDSEYISTGLDSDKTQQDIQTIAGVTKVEQVAYSELTISYGDKRYTEIVNGLEANNSMYYFPDSQGVVNQNLQPENDIILNIDCANELGVKIGDYVNIEGYNLYVKEIANQYMYKNSAMKIDNLKKITNDCTIGYFINQNSRKALNDYVCSNKDATVLSDKEDMYNDLCSRLTPLNGIVYLLVIFGSIMSFIIILIMSHGSFIEQKRLISVLRILGFSIRSISWMWIAQEAAYFILGTIIGVPLGLILEYVLLPQLSSDFWSFPFMCDAIAIIASILLILLTIIMAHVFSIKQISKWNLADNTRSRD